MYIVIVKVNVKVIIQIIITSRNRHVSETGNSEQSGFSSRPCLLLLVSEELVRLKIVFLQQALAPRSQIGLMAHCLAFRCLRKIHGPNVWLTMLIPGPPRFFVSVTRATKGAPLRAGTGACASSLGSPQEHTALEHNGAARHLSAGSQLSTKAAEKPAIRKSVGVTTATGSLDEDARTARAGDGRGGKEDHILLLLLLSSSLS